MTQELEKQLTEEGYYHLRTIPGRGICGLLRFAFTVGLVYNIDSIGYEGRYCFHNNIDATVALRGWSGEGDPVSDGWIKHKGEAGEWSNPLLNENKKRDTYDR